MSVVDLVTEIVAIDLSCADTEAVTRTLDQWRRVKNWGESIEVAAARRLNELVKDEPSLVPERVAADAARVSMNESVRRFDRVKTVDAMPALGDVLQAGATSGMHVDVVSASMRGLTDHERRQVADHQQSLARAAVELTRDEFARHVRRTVKRVLADDGMRTLERQRRSTRLRSWVDRDTGMWCLHGEFDPESGLRLAKRLQLAIETLFHDSTPATAPADPLARQQHLAALALLHLAEGMGARGKTELIVMIDAKTLAEGEHEHTAIDLGIDVDLPIETIRRMACCADVVVPVVTAANGVNMHLGRARRLPTADQTRALRAMYRTCAVPGCEVRFHQTHPHHLKYWTRDHGLTDIDNLVPLCSKHHHQVHDGGWSLAMAPDRSLTITSPDGRVQSTGPPTRGGP